MYVDPSSSKSNLSAIKLLRTSGLENRHHRNALAASVIAMPSIRYYNQTAPLWDSHESRRLDHPFFDAYNPDSRQGARNQEETPQDSSSQSQTSEEGIPAETHIPPHPPVFPTPCFCPLGPLGPPPPPPPQANFSHGRPCPPGVAFRPGPSGPPTTFSYLPGHAPPPGPPPSRGFPFGPGDSLFHNHPRGPHHRGGPNKFRRGGRCDSGSGACGDAPPPSSGGCPTMDGRSFDMSKLREFFATQIGLDKNAPSTSSSNTNNKESGPPADVFDTEDAFIVHVSLPGAKKSDIGVNWDAGKSELKVSGVIHRLGDEELIKTLALDERVFGAFERKVRLGSRATPAQVDIDAIAARMEDGVLIVTIQKLDREYVHVWKVDIE